MITAKVDKYSTRKSSLRKFIFVSLLCCIINVNLADAFQQAAVSDFSVSSDKKIHNTHRPDIRSEQKPWTRWWWMGNAVTKEGITHQLEKMAEANFGGVEISPIYGVEGFESASVDYLSPEWMDLLSHTVSEGNRLGMRVDMITGTGWPFGGDHVATKDAARRLVTQTYRLSEGQTLQERVQLSNRRNAQTTDLHLLKGYSTAGYSADLTSFVSDSGHLNWTPAPGTGNWQLIALFNDWTTMQVKRAAPGAEGHVMDHFSEKALDNYLARFDSAFEPYEKGILRAFFNDSYEVERANWTHDFFDHFKNYRGYDLRDYAGLFFGVQNAELANQHIESTIDKIRQRIKTDFHETIHDLALNRFVKPWVEWTHSQGSRARNQAHGFPGNILDIYGAADIPEMEIFGQSQFRIPGLRKNQVVSHRVDAPNPLILKFASSAAHIEGRPMTSSETATWLDEHFMVSLSQLRPHTDMQFIAGINHTIYHGTTYSPENEEWPGWKFYASTHFAPANTFWDDLGDFNRYMANTQSYLQYGKPDNDILLYFPIHDLWQADNGNAGEPYYIRVHNPNRWFYGTNLGSTAEILWDRGFAFDYISDNQILRLEADTGVLQTGNSSYAAVIIPDATWMPLSTAEKLIDLANSGGTVIFKGNLPQSVPGFHHYQENESRLKKLFENLDFQPTQNTGVFRASTGSGQILKGGNSEYLLKAAGIHREALVDTGLSYIRRSNEYGRHYFLTNLYGEAVDGWIPLAGYAETIVIFDPLTEKSGKAKMRKGVEGTIEFYIQMKPGESRIIKTYTNSAPELPLWTYHQSTGRQYEMNGTWRIEFKKGGPVPPSPVATERLVSWTTFSRDAERFAGTAKYTLKFELPESTAVYWKLDLGRVAVSARVHINGRPAGSVWAHPFELIIPDNYLIPGENELEIYVTNLMINRIIDLDRRGIRWQKFYDINMVDINYRPFDSSGWQPMESGLLGPVTLIPLEIIE
jgi:hypothetical protein